jgi:hypothetical protein
MMAEQQADLCDQGERVLAMPAPGELAAAEGSETSLIYELKNVRPIELLDFTNSLLAIGEQYRAFIRRQSAPGWRTTTASS